MGNELMRRDFLKKAGSLPYLGLLGLATFELSASAQYPDSIPQPGAVLQITREDLVQLFVGPWQRLRAVIERKVIDIHCHVGSQPGPERAEDLIRSMNIHGIGRAMLAKSKASVRNGISYEDDLRTVAGMPPGRLFMWTPPDGYDFSEPQRAAEQVHSRLQAGAKGIGELNVTGTRNVVHLEDYYPTMEVAEALDVPVLFGTRAGAGAERELGNVGLLAGMFPRVNMIIGDAGGADYAHGGGWDAIVLSGTHRNLHLEIGRAPVELIDAAVKYMGPDRVLFGANWTRLNPYDIAALETERADATTAGSTHWRNLNAVALSNTSEAEKELILHKNAERLLKLDIG